MRRLSFIAATLSLLAWTMAASATANRILFSELAPATSTVFIANADGSGEQPLIESASLDYNAAWSPTDDRIVFTSERDGSANLYAVKPDGTGLERLTDSPAYDDQAAFSPDGRQIVFVTTRANGHANLWLLDLTDYNGRRRFPDTHSSSSLNSPSATMTPGDHNGLVSPEVTLFAKYATTTGPTATDSLLSTQQHPWRRSWLQTTSGHRRRWIRL